MPVGAVDASIVAEALRPIWTEKAETAKRTLQRIGVALELARAKGLYPHPSPLPAVRVQLGKQNQTVEHFAALALADLPRFMQKLRRLKSPSALALEFAILTASRTKPVRLLLPEHINGDVWTAPADVMKAGRAHRVPLSARALEVVEAARKLHGTHVFSGGGKAALSDMALLQCVRGLSPGHTTHGFRSAFCDWCRENHIDHDAQEMALAHTIPNKVRAAYARSDLLDQRREIMRRWAEFLNGGK